MLTRALHPSNAKLAELNEHDLSAWATQNAQLLRQSQFDRIDIHNLAEELQDMGRSERRALESFVQNMLMHLLKWQHQPAQRSTSWRLSLKNGRHSIAKLLRDNPSLRPQLTAIIAEEYEYAVANAAAETGLPEAIFPAHCTYSLEQMQAQDWLPD